MAAKNKPKSPNQEPGLPTAAPMSLPVARDAIRGLLDIEQPGFKLTAFDGAMVIPSIGLVAKVSLYDTKTYKGPNAELIVVPRDQLAFPDDAIDRLRTRIGKLSSKRGALKKAADRPLTETLGLDELVVEAATFAPTTASNARRAAALSDALERFDAVALHMNEIYGLRLPRHVAVYAAFIKSLDEIERQGLNDLGRGPGALIDWFEEGAFQRKTRDGLDPRLNERFRADPPELVTVMWGDSDG